MGDRKLEKFVNTDSGVGSRAPSEVTSLEGTSHTERDGWRGMAQTSYNTLSQDPLVYLNPRKSEVQVMPITTVFSRPQAAKDHTADGSMVVVHPGSTTGLFPSGGNQVPSPELLKQNADLKADINEKIQEIDALKRKLEELQQQKDAKDFELQEILQRSQQQHQEALSEVKVLKEEVQTLKSKIAQQEKTIQARTESALCDFYEKLDIDDREYKPLVVDGYEYYKADFRVSVEENLTTLGVDKDFSTIGCGARIGKGGYGEVFEVKMPNCKVFAMKVFCIQYSTRRDSEGMVKEIEVLKTCDNEHIVKYLGFCHIPKLSCIPVMITELMDTNFEDYYTTEIPSPIRTLQILIQVAKGLKYLHHKSDPIIHRDLTARNVLLNKAITPLAKIADFGISRFVECIDVPKEMTTYPASHYHYRAPELSHKSNGVYSGKVDIFSFGHLSLASLIRHVIEKVANSRQVVDGGELKALSEIDRRKEHFSVLQQILGRENHPLENLIKKCLEYRPSDRPLVEELVIKLSEILNRWHLDESDPNPSSKSDSPNWDEEDII